MKNSKKSIIIFTIIILLSIAACSNSEDELKELKTENEKLKLQIERYEKLYGSLNTNHQSNDEILDEENKVNEPNIENINLNQIVNIEDYGQMTISEVNFSQKIEPINKSSYYSYYEVKNPKNTYMDIVVQFKNESTIGLDIGEIMNVRILYDNKYNYNSFSVGEKPGSDLEVFTRLEPLNEMKIHNLVEVPLEVKDSGKKIFIFLDIYGKTYKVNFR